MPVLGQRPTSEPVRINYTVQPDPGNPQISCVSSIEVDRYFVEIDAETHKNRGTTVEWTLAGPVATGVKPHNWSIKVVGSSENRAGACGNDLPFTGSGNTASNRGTRSCQVKQETHSEDGYWAYSIDVEAVAPCSAVSYDPQIIFKGGG